MSSQESNENNNNEVLDTSIEETEQSNAQSKKKILKIKFPKSQNKEENQSNELDKSTKKIDIKNQQKKINISQKDSKSLSPKPSRTSRTKRKKKVEHSDAASSKQVKE